MPCLRVAYLKAGSLPPASVHSTRLRQSASMTTGTGEGRRRMKDSLRAVVIWTVLVAQGVAKVARPVALWVADGLIWLMLLTRRDERRIRPTERVAWPKGLKRELMKRQDNTCVYCGYRRIARTLDIDHIVPVVRGGSNDIGNLQVICRPCNQRKGIQSDEEFRARYASLIPQRRLTPPRRRISQAEFRTETQRTSQSASVQEFRKKRFISKREKVLTGCTVLGIATAVIVLLALSSLGAEGFLLLLPAVVLGGSVAFGIWLRAYMTGVMIEDDE